MPYRFSFVICCAILLGSMYTNAQLSQAEKQQFVDLHNQKRSQVTPTASNMMKVSWDETLANFAQNLANTCKFRHSQNNRYGENLAMGQRDVSAVLDAWFDDESGFFQFPTTCQAPTGKSCGHYTQVAWATTTRIGCGKRQCGNQIIWVCEYNPPGNFREQAPYKQGSPASQCPAGSTPENGLCYDPTAPTNLGGATAGAGGQRGMDQRGVGGQQMGQQMGATQPLPNTMPDQPRQHGNGRKRYRCVRRRRRESRYNHHH